MKSKWYSLFVSLAWLCLVSVPTHGAMIRIEENDDVLDGDGFFDSEGSPTSGDTIWFDLVVHDAMGESADAVKITLAVDAIAHGGSLALDVASSVGVEFDEEYWLFGNSTGPGAFDRGENTYEFGDSADVLPVDPLENEDILGRFAFTWDGVPGYYLVTVDTSTDNTYLLQDYQQVAPSWAANPVTLYVPEPAAIGLVALGAVAALRRRRP